MKCEKTLAAHETTIAGLTVYDLAVHGDKRGWFKENWQRAKMCALGLPDFNPVQNNMSFNSKRGATRGIHAEPWDKFISIASGSIYGVWVDLRPGKNFGRVFACTLDASKAIYVPRGVGNAYQALEDGTTYSYLVNAHWSAQRKSEYTFVNLADPKLAIRWPIPLDEAILSDADKSHPMLADAKPMEPPHVLVTGAKGQLGRALQTLVESRGLIGWEFYDSSQLDITDAAQVDALDWNTYGTVINAAAYTAVDMAESAQGRRHAWKANVSGVGNLARACTEHGIVLVHISSDYVFDGVAEKHDENEAPAPLGVYGQTKAAGDALVKNVPRHLICRTSWVVGDGKNFVRTMQKLAANCALADGDEKQVAEISVVNDQIGRLTFADELAAAIVHLLGWGTSPVTDAVYDAATNSAHALWGTYNVTNAGSPASWAEIARMIFDQTQGNGKSVRPVSTSDYYEGATGPISPRPAHSTLSLDKLRACGFDSEPWEDALKRYLL